MKMLKKLFRTFLAIFRSIYKWLDKHIIVHLTKFFLIISDKFGNQTGRFEKWLTKKSTLLFISLILSVAFFIYVDSQATTLIDSSAEVLYNQNVDVTYNSERYVIEGLPETVDVTLIGRKMDLYLAKQLSTGAVSTDLSSYEEGTYKISLNYESPINSVKYKLDPSTVNITIYEKQSENRTISSEVINSNKLDSKLSVSKVELSQSEVSILGAEHTLESVSVVKALVDVSKIVDPQVGVNTVEDAKLVAYDSDGKMIDVEFVPNKVTATVTIESPTKEVPIKIIPTGKVEFGKAIDSITSDLTKVTVSGNREALENLEYVPIYVKVTGQSEDKEYMETISKPNGVTSISDTKATINVKLGQSTTKEITDVYVETLNLDSNYKALALGENSSKITVVVEGTESVLSKIDASMISAVVDLSKYTEGDYEVPITVTGEEVKASYTPKTTKINIRISKKS